MKISALRVCKMEMMYFKGIFVFMGKVTILFSIINPNSGGNLV